MTNFQTAEQLLAKLTAREPAPCKLAASLLLVRDSADGLEVLMVVRASEVDFASGAMVFPGGKVTDGDFPGALADRLLATADLPEEEIALRVSALREGYEEVGILPALTDAGHAASDGDIMPIDAVRPDVDRGRLLFADALRTAGLRIDVRGLVSFAHLVTPEMSPKRFDTWFYLCPAPPAQSARPDGREIVEARWLTPRAAMALGDDGTMFVMFPTRLVLERLAQFSCVADAMADGSSTPPGLLLPRPEIRDGIVGLASPDVAGFAATWESMEDIGRGKRLGYTPKGL
jgi:8-oxo-dGTP pyrophosphatase MutT (NUDIX family)